MTPDGDDGRHGEEPDEGWDETVLVWNATVARVPEAAARPQPASTPS